ncbi:RNA polymerase sigma-70 factor (ECF subfamily) [Chelatococcus caeni]|uniref:RNA polymerase sigma-70 factor (ECF subfamily) n=1 Tax=Chelatococcus caeni TaxID=1348468 RepID=A0A840BYL5_9HYPH|nr:RNA polymerase sigma factor SigJ [Chelatococcus caeni]MBB4018631.1 RNA polymerase sigma-70 factor (ECF subfamily) [Chelatococcus caeni]
MDAGEHEYVFEEERPRLIGLAYRILGSRADAEDAVQDTWLKWRLADTQAVDNPAAWLTATCTRRCIDMLRSAHRKRVDYIGAWLPEPIHTPVGHAAAESHEIAATLTTAFLLMLERLTPKERAAYLLREIFDMDYAAVAEAMELREPAVRKLVSRAKAAVGSDAVRHVAPLERQQELLAAFQAAVAEGATAGLTRLLAEDIRVTADGGGKATAAREPIEGREAVLDFLAGRLHEWWRSYRWVEAAINGQLGFILTDADAPVAAVTFGFDAEGRTSDVFIMRNPDKLAGLTALVRH